MKVTIEFDGTEEKEEMERALKAQEAFLVLWDIDMFMRDLVKYGITESSFDRSEESYECVLRNAETITAATVMASRIREKLHQLSEEQNILI